MKSKIFIQIGLFAAMVTMLSCSEEFVDRTAFGRESDATFYTTMRGIDLATTAAYSMFCTEKVWDLSFVMTMGSIASDEAEAGAGGKADVVEYQAVDQLIHNPETPQIFEWVWGYFFRQINQCNVVINRIGECTEGTDPVNFNQNILNQRKAECYFLRAFTYFSLTQAFGGVPIVLTAMNGSEPYLPRNEISEVYAQIKSDLALAMTYLQTKSQLGTANCGRASLGAAQALMAKVYLYESSYAKYYSAADPIGEVFNGLTEHWDSVIYWAGLVETSGEYELIGLDGTKFETWRGTETGGYQYIFMTGANNSREEVFSIQARQDNLNWFRSRGTALIRWAAPRKVSTPTGGTDGADHGWGWWCPSPQLIAEYEAGDPRYKATVMTDGDSVLTTVGLYPVNYNVLRSLTGVHTSQRKYECSPDEFWGATSVWKEGPTNVKMMRYADVLLWLAEAYFESSDNAQALHYLNLVRQRARMSGPTGTTVPADLTGTVTHEIIEHERLIELAIEGHRYYDIVRWNRAEHYLDGHVLSDGTALDFIPGRHEFYPIPSTEVVMTGGVISQYVGWR